MITIEQAQEIAKSVYKDTENLPIRVKDYDNFWHINVGFWIGSGGVFVDKADGHFNEIGSVHPVNIWVWGHNNGFKHDIYDLIITKVNDYDATEDFFSRVGLRYPTVNSKPIAWYKTNQVKEVLTQVRPTFQNQRLGLKIPDFKEIKETSNYFEYDLVVKSCQNKDCPYIQQD